MQMMINAPLTKTLVKVALAALLVITALTASPSQARSQAAPASSGNVWSAMGGGITSYEPLVYAVAANGNSVYIGGNFINIGPCFSCNDIAKWDGASWSGLGSGMGMDHSVRAIAVSGTNAVYAGGSFTSA
jgi:hypothetical protein